jgi:hypothetical protein
MRKILVPCLLLGLLYAGPAFATATGLNNIPTADVVPEKVLVLQYYGNFASGAGPDHFLGFKYGPVENVEIGLDGRVFPTEGERDEFTAAQGKIRFELTENLAVAAGLANLGDRARAGREFPYAVLSRDFGFFRAHLGGTVQKDNEGFFGGIDKTVKLFERDLILRSDVIQVNDGDDVVASVGFLYDIGHNVLVESWVSLPSDSRQEDVFTMKLDFVITF